ncbi:L,D-transpeptidase family protein [Sphingomonas sp. LB-2]|uniref:L,D-transpeptidase family protein n=1 Tax=Sphingomonas caeni TaxID=2984949 RepID=UPI0022304263|nr:L,D-transpeptidase family protein [Sphingomonas caeni]MCW3848218.1 L,D-transpeptidase family protein [Sphingomonas caeni]
MSVVKGLRQALIFLCALALGTAIPAAAQVIESVAAFDVTSLKPGDYVWFDEADPIPVGYGSETAIYGPISIVVSIPQQLAYVYRGGNLIAVSTVSTGRDGHETPTGEFTILQKQKFHRSNLYSNAPMPWMQRLTWDGVALHAGHLPGYPASHGCIRLPAAFARQLYDLTELGAQVSVIDEEVYDPRLNAFGPPTLIADTSNLGGEAFNGVTMRSGIRPPPPLVPVRDDGTRPPVSWVTGPAAEVVQPIPPGKH